MVRIFNIFLSSFLSVVLVFVAGAGLAFAHGSHIEESAGHSHGLAFAAFAGIMGVAVMAFVSGLKQRRARRA